MGSNLLGASTMTSPTRSQRIEDAANKVVELNNKWTSDVVMVRAIQDLAAAIAAPPEQVSPLEALEAVRSAADTLDRNSIVTFDRGVAKRMVLSMDVENLRAALKEAKG